MCDSPLLIRLKCIRANEEYLMEGGKFSAKCLHRAHSDSLSQPQENE